jgi:hypothetical protein
MLFFLSGIVEDNPDNAESWLRDVAQDNPDKTTD